jgi:hypothetical protein
LLLLLQEVCDESLPSCGFRKGNVNPLREPP